jgi:hypothetical protein
MNPGYSDSVPLNAVSQQHQWNPDDSFDFSLDVLGPPSLPISNPYSQLNMGLDQQNQYSNSAPWDISPFPYSHVPQINPFEIPTAPEDVAPDTSSIMPLRRRLILHRQSALFESSSPTAAAQVSFSPSTYHIFSAYHVHYLLYFSYVHLF